MAQYAEDFVVEALYHERLPVFAVQWHPERLCFSQAKDGMEDGSRLLSILSLTALSREGIPGKSRKSFLL